MPGSASPVTPRDDKLLNDPTKKKTKKAPGEEDRVHLRTPAQNQLDKSETCGPLRPHRILRERS